ncbi:MAG: TetR/AcrR family transcriptional regulator [Mycetocola sp.]|nr:TetR/AcrR family transcriptional regulator [Mycetocola sp.]
MSTHSAGTAGFPSPNRLSTNPPRGATLSRRPALDVRRRGSFADPRTGQRSRLPPARREDGAAERTVFLAFGVKNSVLTGAVARFLDREPPLTELAAIDPARPLEQKIRSIVAALHRRFEGVFRLMSTLDEEDRPTPASVREDIERLVGAALAPDSEKLRWSAAQIAQLARLLPSRVRSHSSATPTSSSSWRLDGSSSRAPTTRCWPRAAPTTPCETGRSLPR